MKHFHKNRLLQLAAHLRTVKPSKFDMSKFTSDGCGTASCAAGHAAIIFRGSGYRCKKIPKYRGLEGTEAVDKFFGLGHDGYARLFSSCNHPSTPKQVAKRIEKYVKERFPKGVADA